MLALLLILCALESNAHTDYHHPHLSETLFTGAKRRLQSLYRVHFANLVAGLGEWRLVLEAQ